MSNYKKRLTEKLGDHLHYYQLIDSTNDVAKKVENWVHGMVIVAEEQTAGRGTYGRTFYSKAGSGIYMTLIINTDTWHFRHEKLATLYTAVAVSEAIADYTGISPMIKWVNDLFYNSKKIGGILTEKDFQSNKLIIGIGINLSGKQTDFPAEIKATAASLQLEPPLDNQAAALVAGIYEKMIYASELSDADRVLALYKEKLLLMGEVVELVCGREIFEAKVIDVDNEGRLVVLRDGKRVVFGLGKVRVKI